MASDIGQATEPQALPPYFKDGHPNPDWMNAVYELLGLSERVTPCDTVTASQINVVEERVGMGAISLSHDLYEPSCLRVESVLRERGLIR